jgi:uncharacterized protein
MKIFDGQQVFITGASSGIGRECARQCAHQGALVTVVARREERLVELANEFKEKGYPPLTSVVADLTREEDLTRILSLLEARNFDLVVSNAGMGTFGDFGREALEVQRTMLRLNGDATLGILHAAISRMRSQKRTGTLVIVSSVTAFQPLPFMGVYAATKAFNLFHGLALRHELKNEKIKVITLCPGPTESEFGEVARFPGKWSTIGKDSVESVVAALIDGIQRNHALVVPCIRPKAIRALVGLLPYEVSTWLVAMVTRNAWKKK